MAIRRKPKSIEDTRRFVEMTARYQGWKLNPERELLDNLIEGLTINYNRYGYFQCPCRDSWGEKDRDKDIICPCNYCVPDQEEYGHCFCGLFLTEGFYKSGELPKSIPERRPEKLYP